MRRVTLDEELTKLIGPAPDGALLKMGVPDLGGVDPMVMRALPLRAKFNGSWDEVMRMRHSAKQIEQAAEWYEQLSDSLDPDTAAVEDLSDLNVVAAASQTLQADEARLQAAVRAARERGRSWNQLAVALGVSRQAARQRFAARVRNSATLMALT